MFCLTSLVILSCDIFYTEVHYIQFCFVSLAGNLTYHIMEITLMLHSPIPKPCGLGQDILPFLFLWLSPGPHMMALHRVGYLWQWNHPQRWWISLQILFYFRLLYLTRNVWDVLRCLITTRAVLMTPWIIVGTLLFTSFIETYYQSDLLMAINITFSKKKCLCFKPDKIIQPLYKVCEWYQGEANNPNIKLQFTMIYRYQKSTF